MKIESLKGKQKAKLKRLANQKDVMFQIGQSGITDQIVENVLENLTKHEIGRISVLKNCPDSMDTITSRFEAREIMVVYKIGRVLSLYKPNKNLQDGIQI
ncbi:MAG TPA: YhbY family RNA-binding protein [Candidatus Izemoplasmatales bacterium]|nr:YhbY family RNA-binding protein [Candidatus Izemoplasmatales bacterium]